jgi:NADPH-dependent ferric siderophore reductase
MDERTAMTERTRYREVTSEFHATVSEVERIGETHVRVVLGGMPDLALLDTIAVDMGGALRRYTVSAFSDGSAEFVAYRTRRGPATPYLDALQVGASMSGLAPERPVKTPPEDAKRVLVIGDDTAVGVARAVGASHTGRVSVAIVGEVRVESVVTLTGAEVTVVDTNEQLLAWVTNATPGAGDYLILVGEQALNQQVRQHAFGLGVDKESLATRTFWRPDKEGLE